MTEITSWDTNSSGWKEPKINVSERYEYGQKRRGMSCAVFWYVEFVVTFRVVIDVLCSCSVEGGSSDVDLRAYIRRRKC